MPRELPERPSWATPIRFEAAPRGSDAEDVAKVEQNGRKANAGRLICFARWYDERRSEYAQGKPLGTKNPC